MVYYKKLIKGKKRMQQISIKKHKGIMIINELKSIREEEIIDFFGKLLNQEKKIVIRLLYDCYKIVIRLLYDCYKIVI